MKKILLTFTVTLLIAAGCNDFLAERPTKSTSDPIETIEQLEALLNNPTWTETNYTAAFSTDDADIPLNLYDPWTTKFQNTTLYYYTFNTADIPNESTDALWTSLYGSIYKANLIIDYVDKVRGSLEEKSRAKADAYFLRAYSYWVLANYYCQPYTSANLKEPGLARKVSSEMSEDFTQITLEETYALIDKDIEEALKIDLQAVDKKWRTSKAGVKAFLSRYYLHKCEYDKAIEAADWALQNPGTAKLKDYNTLTAGTPTSYTNPPLTVNYCETNNYTNAQVVNWEEFFYLRMTYIGTQWFIPSNELVSLYDKENDQRFKWFFLNGNRRFSITSPEAYRYTIFSDGRYIPSGPTVQEVMLNKAECLIRKNNPDIAGALSLINQLRTMRIAPSPNRDVTASSVKEALKLVLEERRRELPFSHRWLDIRRFSVNETPDDDVAVTRTFRPVSAGSVDMSKVQTYSLPVGSRRYAIPINGVEIDAAKGKIKQNIY